MDSKVMGFVGVGGAVVGVVALIVAFMASNRAAGVEQRADQIIQTHFRRKISPKIAEIKSHVNRIEGQLKGLVDVNKDNIAKLRRAAQNNETVETRLKGQINDARRGANEHTRKEIDRLEKKMQEGEDGIRRHIDQVKAELEKFSQTRVDGLKTYVRGRLRSAGISP